METLDVVAETSELTGRDRIKQTEFIYQAFETSWLFLEPSALTQRRPLLI
jgi:hypothetical protein